VSDPTAAALTVWHVDYTRDGFDPNDLVAALHRVLGYQSAATDHDRRLVDGGDDPEVWARCSDVDPTGRRADEAADRYETWLSKEQW
jgi:hypothetical protein